MNAAIRSYLQATIDNEGLDYAIFDYAAWDNPSKPHYVDDPYFQSLFASAKAARKTLKRYLESEGFTNLH
jgi:hypothetical protein